jgi:hypothetical protein
MQGGKVLGKASYQKELMSFSRKGVKEICQCIAV